MSLREEERLSAEALKAHLQGHLGYNTADWSPVDPDPPDLAFVVSRPDQQSERWAVEVTGLFQYADWKGTEVTRLAFQPRLHRIIDSLNADHMFEMTHAYGLWVDGPLPIKVLNDLQNRILSFVRSGETAERVLDHPEA